MIYCLTVHPVSNNFLKELESVINDKITNLSLTDLRGENIRKIAQRSRELNATEMIIPVEDKSIEGILPVLVFFAGISGCKKIRIANAQLKFTKVGYGSILAAGFKIFSSSIFSIIERYKSRSEIKKLSKLNYSTFTEAKFKNALYLNANMWFGVKAGGSIGHIAGVANALEKRGIKTTYAAICSNDLLSSKINFDSVDPLPSLGVPFELNLYRNSRHFYKKMCAHPQIENFDLIYQRMSLSNYTGVLLKKKFNIPLILEYNGSEAWIAKNWGKPLRYHQLAVDAEALCLQAADIVVTISDVLKEELIERGVPKEKIVSYPNCVEADKYSSERFSDEQTNEVRNQYNIPLDSTVISFMGTFGMWHGAEKLAEAAFELFKNDRKWLDKNKVHFLFMGAGLKMKDVREALDQDSDSYNYATFTGMVPQLEGPLYLAASDILVSPHVANADGSKFFGSPTKLFEYMAMGKGIFASDLYQVGEVLRNSLYVDDLNSEVGDKLAILGRPGNVNDIVKGLKFLVENKDVCKQLGSNSRKEVKNKYTWEKHVDKILK